MPHTDPGAPGTGASPGDDTEMLRGFWSCVGARDVRGARDLTTPDVTIRPVFGFLFSQAGFYGHDGVAQWIAELTAPWEQFEVTLDDLFVLPPERRLIDGDAGRPLKDHGVLAVVRFVAWRGGEPLDARVAMECVIRDGRIAAVIGHDIDDVPFLLHGG